MTTLIDRNECSALVITCSDFRFKSAERAFLEAADLRDDYDLIARPGSIRSLVQPRTASARETMRDEILLLSKLHLFSRVLMVNHVSCRAYDDLTTPENATEIHIAHLRKAAEEVRATIKDVEAEPYLLDYVEGVPVVTKIEDV